MSVYLIADITVTDESWVSGYAANVHEIVHRHGGKYLARSGNIETLEGESLNTTLVALIEFPSKDRADRFMNDPDYAPHAKARRNGSISRLHLVDDTDAAGTIDYLPGP